MPRILLPVCLLFSLSLIAAAESRPRHGDIVVEDFDSHGLRWETLSPFEMATLKIAGKQGLVWKREFQAGEALGYDLQDLAGVPLPDGTYTYEWRMIALSPETDVAKALKMQSGRFQIQEGIIKSLVKQAPVGDFPFLTNPYGNHFTGNLTTGFDLCAGCPDGAAADVVDNLGNPYPARIRSKGAQPGIVLHEDHEDGSPPQYWVVTSFDGDFHLWNPPTGNETGDGIPFIIEDQAPHASLYVASSGRVGVGTRVPESSIHISGVSGTAQLLVEELDPTTQVRTLFQLENNGAPRFALENSSSGIEWSFQQSGPGNFLISKEGTGGPEMQVYQNGRVRMGPAGAINFDLDPSGNLKIKGSLTANGSTFPDYVFEPGYSLMPLSALRTYIEQQKRLPDIPSAEEVKQQGGHNMTELQLKLLEKIEELTLYTLQQQRTIDALCKKDELQQKAIEDLNTQLADIRAMLSDR